MSYSTREAAEVVGLSESIVRGCVRAGFVTPVRDGASMRFGFRDLLVLKLVKALTDQGVPLRRVRKELAVLRRRLPANASLSELSIRSSQGRVVVRADDRAWCAATGQVLFDFAARAEAAPPPAGEIQALPVKREAPAPAPVASLTSDEWFERAIELEDEDPAAAMEAYRRALHLRPDCTETLINLGRLRAESGDTAGAGDCFSEALRIDPRDATALYNLGVVRQDEGKDAEAIELYQRALEIDPNLAEAHYNLATLYDRRGDGHAAIRHINAYRKLTRGQHV